jgi:hypothetical protein
MSPNLIPLAANELLAWLSIIAATLVATPFSSNSSDAFDAKSDSSSSKMVS